MNNLPMFLFVNKQNIKYKKGNYLKMKSNQ